MIIIIIIVNIIVINIDIITIIIIFVENDNCNGSNNNESYNNKNKIIIVVTDISITNSIFLFSSSCVRWRRALSYRLTAISLYVRHSCCNTLITCGTKKKESEGQARPPTRHSGVITLWASVHIIIVVVFVVLNREAAMVTKWWKRWRKQKLLTQALIPKAFPYSRDWQPKKKTSLISWYERERGFKKKSLSIIFLKVLNPQVISSVFLGKVILWDEIHKRSERAGLRNERSGGEDGEAG